MKKKYQVLGLIILMICSIVYDFQKPDVQKEEMISLSYVILEGEFLKTGKYEFEGEKQFRILLMRLVFLSKLI